MDGEALEPENPPNSEVSEQFLRKFASSPSAIKDFTVALQRDEDGVFYPLRYSKLMKSFKFSDLVCQYSAPLILLTLTSLFRVRILRIASLLGFR